MNSLPSKNNFKNLASVAMATFNGERFLQEQLESIASQTVLPYELVICDDQSNDKTIEIIELFKTTAPFKVRVYKNEERLGFSLNFQKAISLCTAEIILLSDQDDIWIEDRVERSVKILTSDKKCGYVFSDAFLIDSNGTHVRGNLWEKVAFTKERIQIYSNPSQQVKELLIRNFVTGATLAFKSKLKKIALPISGRMHDHWISMALSATGYYGHAIEDPFIKYRCHENQLVGVKETKKPLKEKFFGKLEINIDFITKDLDTIENILKIETDFPVDNKTYLSARASILKRRIDVIAQKNHLKRISQAIINYKNKDYDLQHYPLLSAIKDAFGQFMNLKEHK